MLNKINLNKLFLFLLVIGFAVKLIAGYNIRHSFLERGNSHKFLNALAYNLVSHDEFSLKEGISSVDYEPLYPLLMSLAYRISGPGWLALTIFQAIFHALTSYMILLIAKRLWNNLAGFFAGLFHLFYPYLFSYSLSIYDTTLFTFLIIAAIYILFRKKLLFQHFIFMGIIIGSGLLTRGTMWIFILPILAYCFYKVSNEKNLAQAFIACFLVLFSAGATVFPWIIRNKNLSGQLLISTHGPFGLWQGNNDYSYEYLSGNISLDEIYSRTPRPEIYKKYPRKSREPKEAVMVANEFQKEAKNWIINHPREFIKLAFLKAQKLWTWNRNPVSSALTFGSNESRQTINIITYLPLLLLSPFGLFVLTKKNAPVALLFLAIICCFTLAHMVVMGFTRARLPLDPLLMVLFGIALSEIINFFSTLKSVKN